MSYAKIENQKVIKYPYTIIQLRKDNPYTSFTQEPSSEELKDFNTVIVKQIDQPIISYLQKVIEKLPQFVNNEWVQVWEIVEATAEEVSEKLTMLSNDIRRSRNDLLTQSDWTQVADAPVDKQAWATYRQALRDITQQTSFPFDIVWPNAPQY